MVAYRPDAGADKADAERSAFHARSLNGYLRGLTENDVPRPWRAFCIFKPKTAETRRAAWAHDCRRKS